MTKASAGAAALILALTLGGCSSLGLGSSPAGSGESGGTATASGTSSAPARARLDQSTPEAAMTSWLRAMMLGDGATVCQVMASDGKPVPSVKGAAAACSKAIAPMLASLKEAAGTFEGLTVTGATVKGSTATFEAATTTPPLAAQIVAPYKAVEVAGRWYVTP